MFESGVICWQELKGNREESRNSKLKKGSVFASSLQFLTGVCVTMKTVLDDPINITLMWLPM